MPRRRLEQLGAHYALSGRAIDRFERLLTFLGQAEQAPTTVTDPKRAVDVHVADSLSGLEVPELCDAGRIADLGSGAGFPAVVLAVARPDAQITAVESNRRKCAFISDLAGAMGLENMSVACARAEEWAVGRGGNDAVCARALAPLGVLCEYAAPLLTVGGALVAWKGRLEDDEVAVARHAAAELGLTAPAFRPVEPYPGSEHRQFAIAVKRAPTPDRFPRRTGVALKRPLGPGIRRNT